MLNSMSLGSDGEVLKRIRSRYQDTFEGISGKWNLQLPKQVDTQHAKLAGTFPLRFFVPKQPVMLCALLLFRSLK